MFIELNNDPEVIKYTGDKAFTSEKVARQFLEKYTAYKNYGLGRYAVIHKQSKAYLAWCGIKYDPAENEYDIGFRFFRKYWNQGFATETAHACLKYGFEKKNLTRVVGKAAKENHASIRVLEKIGMTYCSEFNFDGVPGVKYEVFENNYTHS